jgi:hyperosmotically inducible periplasmic protein
MNSSLRILTIVAVLSGSTVLFNAGCAGTPTRRSTSEFVDDATLTTRVKTQFVKDPIVKALQVNVDTFKGNVQLNGSVDTAEQKARAEQIARGIEGVVGVQNNLAIKAQPSP